MTIDDQAVNNAVVASIVGDRPFVFFADGMFGVAIAGVPLPYPLVLSLVLRALRGSLLHASADEVRHQGSAQRWLLLNPVSQRWASLPTEADPEPDRTWLASKVVRHLLRVCRQSDDPAARVRTVLHQIVTEYETLFADQTIERL